jgi:hypothetical protein
MYVRRRLCGAWRRSSERPRSSQPRSEPLRASHLCRGRLTADPAAAHVLDAEVVRSGRVAGAAQAVQVVDERLG